MHMIKRLICLIVLYFVSFYVGTLFSPNMGEVKQQEEVQKERLLVQETSIEEKKDHKGVIIGHIVGQYQHIYKTQKTASVE